MVQWEAWSPDAFARASRERKPVLLSITAAWCRACHEMDRTTYADPDVAARVAAGFVPVRVDADRRPDINERYNLGGWPTTAFLTADGQLITGGTFVAADRMSGVLSRVAEAFAARAAEWGADFHGGTVADAAEDTDHHSAVAGDTAESADPEGEHRLIEGIYSTFDDEYGGFGVEPKFPLAAPIALALRLFRESGETRWRDIVERTLDAMWNGLWDAAAGGLQRYAATRDWQQPHVEKLLDTNAALLALYAEASVVLGRPVDRARAAAIGRFMTVSLRDARGGYYGSDAERTLYVDGNAAALSSLLAAASALEDPALAREALASFERVLLAAYKPGDGVAHQVDGAVRGLLGDQIAAITALLDAHDLTGGEPYQMMAEEIGHYAVRVLADDNAGGFFDRAARHDDVGLLRLRRKPFAANADAAIALSRLQQVSREFDFTTAAAGALAAARRQAARQGPLAAHYVLATRFLR